MLKTSGLGQLEVALVIDISDCGAVSSVKFRSQSFIPTSFKLTQST